ncbi:MAG: hypothetical protein VB144_11690 [Clostridia bacterium]|nr:hypothetical protein [Clostridia bacterium]
MVEIERAIDVGICMGVSWDSWEAVTMVKRQRGTCLMWAKYEGRGGNPEAALAALKKAVAEGEEGWSW